jgi:hypothetical protein
VRFGPYQVTGELGRGAMGVVLRAREPETGREVAIKTLLRPDPQAVVRFRREAETLGALDHPGVVRVHATGELGGLPYLVCELIEGARPLDQASADLALAARVALVRDACRALGHAHARGVVHRDVKPDNLLVDAAGRVRVTDFGVAALEDRERLTRTGAFVGTPSTMAPEQTTGAAVGPTADVWALGVVLYQALTGELPFEARSLPELFGCIHRAQPVPPRRRAAGISRELEAVCLRALAREPDDRWPDGEAMAVALDQALAGGGASRGGARWWLPLAVAASAVALLALGVALVRSPAPPSSPAATTAPPPPGPVAPTTAPPPPAPADDEPADDEPAADEPAAERARLARASERGDPTAAVEHGRMLLEGRGGERDRAGAVAEFARAAEAGSGQGAIEYARAVQAGLVPGERVPLLDRAGRWLRAAIDRAAIDRAAIDRVAGDRVAVRDLEAALGDLLLDYARPDDVTRGMDLLERANDAGSLDAQLRLAARLLSGTFLMPAPARARELALKVRAKDPEFRKDEVADLLRRCDEAEQP